jgi:ankyrin repeat protein
LLAHGADIDTTDAAGNTALMIAAARDYADVAAILVDSGADVNVVGARQHGVDRGRRWSRGTRDHHLRAGMGRYCRSSDHESPDLV